MIAYFDSPSLNNVVVNIDSLMVRHEQAVFLTILPLQVSSIDKKLYNFEKFQTFSHKKIHPFSFGYVVLYLKRVLNVKSLNSSQLINL